MTKFYFSDEQISIINAHGHRVDISPEEAIELLQWLSDKKTMLLHLSSYQDIDERESGREQMEIYIQQQHQIHLDALKAAIPQLQEATPAGSIFIAPADVVTDRAIELLKAYQIEYHIHPLLEDDGAFAQG
ncbi:MAG: hypothetical protein JOZ18_08910 [Chloroflexi bacterium]|nr:hypothetical protein [Chloroflexota bacterium]